jgi:hypothetical protein
MAEAALLHFASLAKSRNWVLVATAPVTDPLRTTVTNINVHMLSLQLATFRRKNEVCGRCAKIALGTENCKVGRI